jgi:hypothetical protein
MRVWIGLKRGNEYVLEWNDEVENEGGLGQAVGRALAEYTKNNKEPIWGLSILIDKK